MAAGNVGWLVSNLITAIGKFKEYAASSSSSSVYTLLSRPPCSSILEDLCLLTKMLQRIQAVLHDAEKRVVVDLSIKLWLHELQDLAYDAEDVLDDFHYELLRAQVAAKGAVVATSDKGKQVVEDNHQLYDLTHASPSLSNVTIPDDMGNKIKEIIEGFDDIAKHRDALHLRAEDGAKRLDHAMYRPPSSSFVDNSAVFGREDDKKMLIDWLLSEDRCSRRKISVFPIVGMGGIGKTTLAQIVYNDPIVCQYFSKRRWVCVSDDFDVVRLTKAIISSMTNSSCAGEELNDLQSILYEELVGKKFLLVLDDIWNDRPSLWESLQAPLYGAGTGKIIVTTRDERVALMMQTEPFHKLDCLSDEHCWSLFQSNAFEGQDPIHRPNLVKISRKIVHKCRGLPLAVKALGGLLRCEIDEEKWMDVLGSEIWELGETENVILPALRLSYNHMPTNLKPCFLYCSLFPKDWEFSKDELVRQWMAQGYIPSGGRKTLEHIGNEYFNELLRRSFLGTTEDSFGIKGIKMHDMIHDLASSISRKQFCPIRSDVDLTCDKPIKFRYLNVMCELPRNFSSIGQVSTLRTLFVSAYDHHAINILQPLLTKMTCLRALALNIDSVELLDSIMTLKHLRYLDIRCCCGMQKCKWTFHLYYLQTLVLNISGVPAELPVDIGNLINLRYLEIVSDLKRLPKSTCCLSNLRYLKLDCYCLEELPVDIGNLISLQHLYINSYAIRSLPESTSCLYNLQELFLDCYQLETLPACLRNGVNLCHLDLRPRPSLIKLLGEAVTQFSNLQALVIRKD